MKNQTVVARAILAIPVAFIVLLGCAWLMGQIVEMADWITQLGAAILMMLSIVVGIVAVVAFVIGLELFEVEGVKPNIATTVGVILTIGLYLWLRSDAAWYLTQPNDYGEYARYNPYGWLPWMVGFAAICLAMFGALYSVYKLIEPVFETPEPPARRRTQTKKSKKSGKTSKPKK